MQARSTWGRGNVWGITLGVFLGITIAGAVYLAAGGVAAYLAARSQVGQTRVDDVASAPPQTPSREQLTEFLKAVEGGSVPEMLAFVEMKRALDEEERLLAEAEQRRLEEEEQGQRRMLAGAVWMASEDTARVGAAYQAALARMPYGTTSLRACLARAAQAPNVGIQEEMEAVCRRAWR